MIPAVRCWLSMYKTGENVRFVFSNAEKSGKHDVERALAHRLPHFHPVEIRIGAHDSTTWFSPYQTAKWERHSCQSLFWLVQSQSLALIEIIFSNETESDIYAIQFDEYWQWWQRISDFDRENLVNSDNGVFSCEFCERTWWESERGITEHAEEAMCVFFPALNSLASVLHWWLRANVSTMPSSIWTDLLRVLSIVRDWTYSIC